MTTVAILPLPPVGVPFVDPDTHAVNLQWQNYLLTFEQSLTPGYAPLGARYVVTTADADLTDEVNLGALTTGYLKVTVALGIATPATVATIPASDITFPVWNAVTFAAGTFTANGSMTWTVASGDQTTFRYVAIGKTVSIALSLATTTVGGTPDTTLQVTLPNSYAAKAAQSWPFYFNDDGIKGLGKASVAASGTVLKLEKANGTKWNVTTDNTDIAFSGTLEVT